MENRDTQYGFVFGPITVERLMSDNKEGWVLLSLVTKREAYELYVSKGGKFNLTRIKPESAL